ncbi:high mobility group B3 [Actinidia rufa]|uniref:High mobility group B3 n=1 Tax=Actinidia rufa TaxID=165716 RepID=A0A7J0DKS8_9ERIC|nr:high mobility group B3 [Actinidia rufa]
MKRRKIEGRDQVHQCSSFVVRISVKKRGIGSEKARNKPAKKRKLANNPNKPKRPASAFFVFMNKSSRSFVIDPGAAKDFERPFKPHRKSDEHVE